MYSLDESTLQALENLSKLTIKDKENYRELSDNYRNQQYNKLDINLAVAYAQARMPATYSVIRSVLDKFVSVVGSFSQNLTVLDVGAGVGTLNIALRNILDNFYYEALEHSESMINVFRILNGKNVSVSKEDFLKFHSNNKYQMVFASYFINEIKDKDKALRKLFDLSDRYVFIIEPGTPVGYKNILKSKEIAKQLGWHIVLPCSRMDCSLKQSDWCHFSVRLPRTKLHARLKQANLSYEDEKFSYVIFSKQETCFENNNIIVKKPIKRSGHIIFDVCSKDGVCRVVRTDKDSKKLNWGDKCSMKISN